MQVQDATTKEVKTLPVDTVLATETSDFTAAEKSKLAGIEVSANNYVHPTTDGNKHLPANGTTNAGKVPTASAVAGEWTLETPANPNVESVTKTSEVLINRFVGYAASGDVDAGGSIQGVTSEAALAANVEGSITHTGIAEVMLAEAVITVGSELSTDTDGKAILTGEAQVVVAVAREIGSIGDVIKIRLK